MKAALSRKVIASWDSRAAAYDRLTRRWPVFGRMAARLVSELPRSFGGLAVDLAGGAGLLSELLLERRPACRVALVEPAPAMLRLARRRLGSARVGFHALSGEDAWRLGLGVDAALCSAAAHLMDEKRLFASVGRLLKPGGLFCLNLWWHSWAELARDADFDAWWRRPAERALREAGLPAPDWSGLPRLRPRTREGLREAAARAGFELERVRVDEDRLPARFAVDFMAMSPDWPAPGLGERRARVVRRARALACSVRTARTVRLRFLKIG